MKSSSVFMMAFFAALASTTPAPAVPPATLTSSTRITPKAAAKTTFVQQVCTSLMGQPAFANAESATPDVILIGTVAMGVFVPSLKETEA
ncbi:hypothetical protein ACLOAV_007179 [Pseudogymnoascus australis]